MLMRIKDIAALIESIAPLSLQEDYDNAGLQVGDPEQEVTGVVLSLDVTEETVRVAKDQGANLIVSHHPLLFRGIKQINPRCDYISRVVIEAIKGDIAIYSAHTNLDNAPMGVNRKISEVLGLTDVRPLAALLARQTAGLSAEVACQCGSGMVGELPEALSVEAFVRKVKELDFAPRGFRTKPALPYRGIIGVWFKRHADSREKLFCFRNRLNHIGVNYKNVRDDLKGKLVNIEVRLRDGALYAVSYDGMPLMNSQSARYAESGILPERNRLF